MRPDAGTVGNGTHTPTHESPTPAQGNMGADLATPGTQRDTSRSGSPHGTGSINKDDAGNANVNTDTRYSVRPPKAFSALPDDTALADATPSRKHFALLRRLWYLPDRLPRYG
ncbi:hypothetical protein GCM10027514_12610 [Azotobacter armeniacus]